MSPVLRLFNPESCEPFTLRDFYDQSILPEKSHAAPSTLGEHRLALYRWEQFCRYLCQNGPRTARPGLQDIDTDLIAQFLLWMQETPHENLSGVVQAASGRSAAKSLTYIRSWVSTAAERGKAKVLGKTPPPQCIPGDHRIQIPADHVDRLMKAAKVATWPTRWWRAEDKSHVGSEFEPALFWRSLIVWLYIFGQRRGDVLGLKRENRPHVWANVVTQKENPHPNGSCQNEHGWLCFTQSKTNKDLVLPIPAVARQWLNRVAETFADRRPTDAVLSIGRSKREFYTQWDQITDSAGVSPKASMQMVDGVPVMRSRRYLLKNFRSTAASVIEAHARVGRYVTGHAADRDPRARIDSGVFESNYLTSEQAVLRALTTLPLPETFTALL